MRDVSIGAAAPSTCSIEGVVTWLSPRRSSQVVADIDQALLRIKEGSYGICARCGQPIDERRLEAVPTARYDAKCQSIIESANGDDDLPTL